MDIRTARRRLGIGVIAVISAGMMAVGTSPASAKSSDGFVRGYDKYTDDWNDEGTLSTSTWTYTNATCLWQTILWAEGAKKGNGYAFSASDIDGVFGADTKAATKNYQTKWGLGADGAVGGQTFGHAMNWVIKTGGSTARGATLYLAYEGRDHVFQMKRTSTGKYMFREGGTTWHTAAYKSKSCS